MAMTDTDGGAAEDVLLPVKKMRARYCVSDMWLWRVQRSDPEFPKPVVVRNRRFWRLSELMAWEEKRKRADAVAS
jgi:predicted DNA-binding transcriptional regulator AlpA